MMVYLKLFHPLLMGIIMSNVDIKKYVAEKVISKTSIDPEQKFGSVIALLMVISICITAIRVVQECEKNRTKDFNGDERYAFFREKIKYFGLKRSWFHTLRLKRIIRQHMDVEDYREYRNELAEAILDTSITLTEKETHVFMEAADNV